MTPSVKDGAPDIPHVNPFRRAVLRGLAVLLPPLLTVVIFVWVGKTVNENLLSPMREFAKQQLVWVTEDVEVFPPARLAQIEADAPGAILERDANSGVILEVVFDGQSYHRVREGSNTFVPTNVYEEVENGVSAAVFADLNSTEMYEKYVELKYLQWYVVVPLFLCVFILALYLLGKFLAAGIGRFFWVSFERIIHRLPLIRNVYSSVKQVTDFMLSEGDMEYTRVVAIEYPRRGIWSLAFVTGESMLDIRSAANEAVLSVLIPTSPAPFTGYTVTLRKSEAIDLNITVDQAFQFIVSCGVVIPPSQIQQLMETSPGQLPGAAADGLPSDSAEMSVLPSASADAPPEP